MNTQGNLEKIYENNKNMVYGMLLKSVHDKQDVDDLFQCLWTKVVENKMRILSFDERKAKNYIRAMTRNLLCDYFGSKKKLTDNVISMDDCLYETADPDNVENIIFGSECRQVLQEIIEHLETDERKLLFFRYRDELSLKEIGYILGISENATKMRFQRVKKKIIKELRLKGDDCIEREDTGASTNGNR